MPQRPRTTTEKLIAYRKDGSAVDQYGHTAGECAAAGEAARRHALELRRAADDVGDELIVLGKLGGARQIGRLEAAAELFDRLADRDEAFAASLAEIPVHEVPNLRDFAARRPQQPDEGELDLRSQAEIGGAP